MANTNKNKKKTKQNKKHKQKTKKAKNVNVRKLITVPCGHSTIKSKEKQKSLCT
jgi:hypothetical protein